MPPCLTASLSEGLPPRRERNPISSGIASTFSRVFPAERNETESPPSTFTPYFRRLFYSCNARNPGGGSPGRATSSGVAVAASAALLLPVMAPQMRQVTTFCRASEQRAGERGGSWVGRSGSGGVIERSPGSLETHFPFPQNERSGRPGQVGRKGGREEGGEGRTTSALLCRRAVMVQTRSEVRKKQKEKTKQGKGCAITNSQSNQGTRDGRLLTLRLAHKI